VKCLFVDMLSC